MCVCVCDYVLVCVRVWFSLTLSASHMHTCNQNKKLRYIFLTRIHLDVQKESHCKITRPKKRNYKIEGYARRRWRACMSMCVIPRTHISHTHTHLPNDSVRDSVTNPRVHPLRLHEYISRTRSLSNACLFDPDPIFEWLLELARLNYVCVVSLWVCFAPTPRTPRRGFASPFVFRVPALNIVLVLFWSLPYSCAIRLSTDMAGNKIQTARCLYDI